MIETLKLLGINKTYIKKFCCNSKFPHTHNSVDDAIQCGYEYLRLKLLIKQHQLIKNSTYQKSLLSLSLVNIFICFNLKVK